MALGAGFGEKSPFTVGARQQGAESPQVREEEGTAAGSILRMAQSWREPRAGPGHWSRAEPSPPGDRMPCCGRPVEGHLQLPGQPVRSPTWPEVVVGLQDRLGVELEERDNDQVQTTGPATR